MYFKNIFNLNLTTFYLQIFNDKVFLSYTVAFLLYLSLFSAFLPYLSLFSSVTLGKRPDFGYCLYFLIS